MSNVMPLEGIKVIDLTIYVSGPATSRMLADWGADVIKVEAPSGDQCRPVGATLGAPCTEDCNPFFATYNINKRGLVLDLKKSEGREIMDRLLDEADVFISNMRPKALTNLGLDFKSIHEKHPRVVWAAINGFGNFGPEKDDAGYDTVAYWAHTGLQIDMSEKGETGPSPLIPFYGVGDGATGATLAGAIGTALYQREKTGEGCEVFASLLAQGIWSAACSVVSSQFNDKFPKTRLVPNNPVVNSYRSKDGEWFTTSIFDVRKYPGFFNAMGRPELADDPRYNNPASAHENSAEMTKLIETEFAKYDYAELVERLRENDVAFSHISRVSQVATNVQARENKNVYEYTHRNGEVSMMPMSPVAFGQAYEPVNRLPYPKLGEHTVEILKELDYSDEEIQKLLAEGAAVAHD